NTALTGEDLSRGHPDFWATVVVDSRFGEAADGGADDVYQAQEECSLPTRLVHRGNGVCGLARLTNPHHHGARPDVGLAIAHFAGNFHFDDQIGEFLEDIPCIQTSVVASATRDNDQMLRLFQTMEHFIEPAKVRHALTTNEPAAQGIGNGVWLLED